MYTMSIFLNTTNKLKIQRQIVTIVVTKAFRPRAERKALFRADQQTNGT